MCLYTPQATRKRVKASSSGTKTISSSLPRTRERATVPTSARIIVNNQPAAVPPPAIYAPYAQQPRIEVIGEGETTNIYLPSPAPTQNGQFQGQNNSNAQGQGQQGGGKGQAQQQSGGQGQERRRSSMIVQEVEGVMRLAKRVGDAVRRGSASSFGKGRVYYREEARRERSRERRSHRERRRLYERTASSSRSRSRGRRREVIEVRDLKQLKVVDEEARQMARYAGEMAEGLVREREMKKEAKRLVEKKWEDEERKEQKLAERLEDRVLSRYGRGGLLGPPPSPRGRRLLAGGDDWRDKNGGGDWRDNVSWAPWNAASYNANYAVSPPVPLQPPAQAHTNNSTSNAGNGDNNGGGRGSRRERSRSTSRERTTGSNHIHVHTAPLVQGPQISNTKPGGASSGAYGEMPGMSAASNSAGLRRSSWVEPYRQVRAALESGLGGMRGYAGLGLGMPGVQTQFVSGLTPTHAMNDMSMGMGMGMGMGGGVGGMGVHAEPVVVPFEEREWQRARVYSSHAPDNGLGGMMY